jgi:hypothetical protein
MEKNHRKPMFVDIDFENRMKSLQKKIRMKKGEEISLRQLTKEIGKFAEFDAIERKILGDAENISLNIKFDTRGLR